MEAHGSRRGGVLVVGFSGSRRNSCQNFPFPPMGSALFELCRGIWFTDLLMSSVVLLFFIGSMIFVCANCFPL